MNKKTKKEDEALKVIDEVVDDLVDILLTTKKFPGAKKEAAIKSNEKEMIRLRGRIKAFGNVLGRHISRFKLATMESEREISEKMEDLKREIEERDVSMEGQLGELRNKLRTLTNEVNKLKK